MAFPSKGGQFQPVVLFQIETAADQLAVDMVHQLYREVAETMDTDRSRQTAIGVSEIGNDCLKCVARKLAEIPEPAERFDAGWKAQVGTFIHAGLEEHFQAKYGVPQEAARIAAAQAQGLIDGYGAVPNDFSLPATDEQPIFHMERKVVIHKHKHLTLAGSCDLFIEGASFGLVCDWKTQGPSVLKKSGAGKISPEYRVQMPGYGLGYELLGKAVTHTVMFALPRDGELWDAKPVLQRYDRSIVVERLAQLDMLIDAAEVMEVAFPGSGWQRVIDAQPSTSGCWDCRHAENQENTEFFSEMFQ